MTLTRLLEKRSGRPSEQRSGIQTSYGWTDPSAIPPPGMGSGSTLQRAGVTVTQHTMLQVDVVFTALRIIDNNFIKMGDPRAYTEDLSGDNIPFWRFLAEQPALLTDTWGGRMFQYTGRSRSLWSMALFGETFWY